MAKTEKCRVCGGNGPTYKHITGCMCGRSIISIEPDFGNMPRQKKVGVRAIEILECSLKTHNEWFAYFEKHPEAQSLEEYKHIGDLDFHKGCIEDYSTAISEIKQLMGTNNG
jgi:hypothetical protein